MRITTMILSLLAFGAAACGEADRAAAPAEAGAAPAQTAAAPAGYVGLWGADEAQCADPAWRFAANEVSTRGEVPCALADISAEGARYAIRAMCTGGPPAAYHARYTSAARALVSGGRGSRRLVYCAPHP